MEGGKYIGLHPAKNQNKKKSFLGVIFEVFLKNSKTGSLKILSKNQNLFQEASNVASVCKKGHRKKIILRAYLGDFFLKSNPKIENDAHL